MSVSEESPRQRRLPLKASKRWRENLEAYTFLAPALLVIAFVFIYPVIQIFRYSCGTINMKTGETVFVGLRNYSLLAADPIFWWALRNNLLLLGCIPILIFISVIVASLLYDRVAGWRIYRVIMFMPYMIAIVVVGIAFSYIFSYRGALNVILEGLNLGSLKRDWIGTMPWALLSMAFVIIWRETGFGSVLFLARLMSVSEDLYDAAKVDGANWFQRLIYVTIPQLRGVIAFWATLLVVAMFAWVFNYVYVMTQGGPAFKTVVSEYYIYLHAFKYYSPGTASAFSAIMFLVAVAVMSAQFLLRKGSTEEL
jgi:ABC-type sugar transport system permease subunit